MDQQCSTMKLCIIISLLVPAVGASAPNQTLRPLVDYSFFCGSDGNSKVDTHSLLGDLIGVNSTDCHYENNGVSSNSIVESNTTIAPLRNHFLETNASGLAVELWITPTVGHGTVSRPILAIGGLHYQDEEDDYYACRNTELYLGMRGDLLEIRYVDNDPRMSCRVLLVRQQPLRNENLTQIMLTLYQGETRVYINGEPIVVGAPNYLMTNLTMWNSESSLQLFSNQFIDSPTQAFTGSVHQLSIYAGIITDDQIKTVYQQGLEREQDKLAGRQPLQLVALAEPSTVIQGQSSGFYVGGLNRSTSEYLVQVEVTSLPTYGNILGDEGPIKAVGTRVALPGTWRQTSLFYRSWSDEVFTSPGFSYSGKDLHLQPEVFEYRLVATDRNDGALLGWSTTVRKEIFINHVNQPPALLIPKIVTVPVEQPTSLGARPIATIQGAQLQDPDRNVDRVRVDIWTYNGTIALRNYHELADFSPRTNRSRPNWQCNGSPEGSRNMTFLAEPDSVSLLLSNVQYEGFHWNQEDTIVIRIYDGSGGPCLEEDEHKYNSIHNGCYEIVAAMSIPAIAQTPKDFSIQDVSMLQLSFWLLCLIPLMALCCVIQCFCKCRKRFCRRGRGGGIELGNPSTEEEMDDQERGDFEAEDIESLH